MIGPIARIGDAFRVPTAVGWLVAILAVGAATAVAAIATWLGVLPLVLVVLLGAFATVVSFRWPLVALALFAALVPIEEVGLLEGIGTISRIAGLMFAVTYGIPRLGRLSLGAMPWAGWVYVLWAIFEPRLGAERECGTCRDPDAVAAVRDRRPHRGLRGASARDRAPGPWVYSLSAADRGHRECGVLHAVGRRRSAAALTGQIRHSSPPCCCRRSCSACSSCWTATIGPWAGSSPP